MHERTERAIARLLFVVCCAVPTIITLLVILVTWTPWYHRYQLAALTARLSDETGLVVTIEDFRRDSPSKWVLNNILLLEPETGHEVARIGQLTWLSESDRIGILLHQPELQSSQLQHAWHLVHQRFLCRPDKTSTPIQLSANDLAIRSTTGSLRLSDVDAWIRPVADAVQADLECVPEMGSAKSPVKISVRRDRGGPALSTNWTLETGDAPLPCSALADYLPLMRSVGADAEFQGVLSWEWQDRGGWTIDLGGSRFIGVDLGRLCENNMPHRLTGRADVQLDRCFIDPGKAVNVSGTILARDGGYVGHSLLRVMHEHLGVAVDTQVLQVPSQDVFYQLIALHFRIADSELKLEGVCGYERGYETLPPGVMLCANRRVIAQTSDRTMRSTRMLSVVSPPHSELIPVASQTQNWMNLLIPPNSSLSPGDGMAPAGRIRTVKRPTEESLR